jgi:hypothetical protein
MYADRDVTLIGSMSEDEDANVVTITYDLSLKKGWNLVYVTWTETETEINVVGTTTPVEGLKWYAEKDFWELFDSQKSNSTSKRLNKTFLKNRTNTAHN